MSGTKFTHPIPALEGAVRRFELCFFLLRKLYEAKSRLRKNRHYSPWGAILNSDKLRDFLLRIHSVNEASKVTREEFLSFLPGYEVEKDFPRLKSIFNVPIWLTSWTRDSRRVYSLSPEVQAVLENTSLKDMAWEDVKFPFPSYAMQLATPIFGPPLGKSDFIVVSEVNSGEFAINQNGRYLSVIAFRLDSSKAAGVSDKLRARLSTLPFKPKDLEARCREILQIVSGISNFDSISLVVNLDDSETLFSKSNTAFITNHASAKNPLGMAESLRYRDQLLKIVIGFTIYLKSLPAKGQYVSTPHEKRTLTTGEYGPVSPAEICNVSSFIKLSREERVAYGLEGTPQERAEFERNFASVEGYWRRPKGQGSNPGAERTVRVRSYFVRRDRAPDFGLLPGAIKEV